MDAREINRLVNVLEGILNDVNDDNRRGVAIDQYLYQRDEKRILLPGSLWNIIICLDKVLEEKESYKKAQLDYRLQEFKYQTDCNYYNNCDPCWSNEKLVFVVDGDNFIEIAAKSHVGIMCSEAEGSIPAFQFCAVCIRGCIYQYKPLKECYIPKEFYQREMFVFFLYSFDALYICLKYCIENRNQSLNTVFRDVLDLGFKYCGMRESEFEQDLSKDSSEGAKFVATILYNCRQMRGVGCSDFMSILNGFMLAMKKRRKAIVDFLRDNEEKSCVILGKDLYEKMLTCLSKNWLSEEDEF